MYCLQKYGRIKRIQLVIMRHVRMNKFQEALPAIGLKIKWLLKPREYSL